MGGAQMPSLCVLLFLKLFLLNKLHPQQHNKAHSDGSWKSKRNKSRSCSEYRALLFQPYVHSELHKAGDFTLILPITRLFGLSLK